MELARDTNASQRAIAAASRPFAIQPSPQPACLHSDPRLFLSLARLADAAELCGRCPVATACLAHAMSHDIAYRTGADPYGVTGLYAGVWFDPDHIPRRVVDLRHQDFPSATPGSTVRAPAATCRGARPAHQRSAVA